MALRRRSVAGGRGRAALAAPGQVGGGRAAHELFGPFPGAPADGEAHIALEAAVFEDFGDKISRTSRSNARDAHRRAADAQRAFAGLALSQSEAAARLAAANRIDGKAQS